MKYFLLLAFSIFPTACDYTEVERETGYKGKARTNPWLAAERFAESYSENVNSLGSWKAPESGDSTWFVPVSILSNTSFTRRIETWVNEGGHLVLLVEHANAETNDWAGESPQEKLEPALIQMLERVGITLDNENLSGEPTIATEIEFEGNSYLVNATSASSVVAYGGEPGVFASVESGEGRISVLTDARLFRNRWIAENEHADLFDALIQSSDREGNIGFIRSSGLSLWRLLKKYVWPVLVALSVLIVLWLWKNFSRFGPLEAETSSSNLRGYDHHLEALGNFQWRLDRAAGLLIPLRSKIIEYGQRVSTRAGCRDDDFLQFLADRTDIPRERVARALTEVSPADSTILTRTTADLQRLQQFLH